MERKQASDYPQELLDLFHEYQHGDIDRRTFLDRLGKFATGGLTAMAIFESLRPNYAWAQQVPLAAIADGIRQCRGIPGRMERVDDGAPFAVLVDYAHTPDALERAVRVLRSLAEGRLIVVFGCGGDRDRGKRPLMGEAAARIADVVIATSDNPRSEDPLKILHEIERGIVEAGLDPIQEAAARRDDASGYLIIPDRRRAIHLAIEIARPSDVVLIAGKGAEPGQELADRTIPFDDRESARDALRALGART